ncbi:PMSR domain-containing protein, partial [Haematococcus lacustris]
IERRCSASYAALIKLNLAPNAASAATTPNYNPACEGVRGKVCSLQGARSHVTALNTGKDDVEQMGSSVQTQVADMVDVDRTGELLIWLFQSLLKDRRQQGQQASQPRFEQQQGVKEGEGV